MERVNVKAVGFLRQFTEPGDADEQLLGRFVAAADEEAFAELVRRHGPMVLAACRRILGTGPDADDAFQAAFLVLARKAAKLRDGRTIGCWLFGVARHASLKLRDKERRRKWHESKAIRSTTMENNESSTIEAVDEELHRLAERYRSPLVACLLEGQTQEEAAREAGCSLSTLRRNLDKGRELLRGRLTRRGIVPAVALMGLGEASVPPVVAGDVARLAVGFLTGESAARSAAIAQGVLKMMTREKFKAVAASVLLLAGIAGSGVVWQFASAQQLPLPAQPATKEKQANPPAVANPAAPAAKVENKIRPGDVLYMSANNVFETAPLSGVYAVEAAGTLAIGPTYGKRVKVEGLTIEEAEKAIEAHVRNYARKAEIMLRRADPPDLELRVRLLELEVKELKEAIAELRKKK